ncbi:MAG: hypothetical protein GX614_03320 [Sandaracinaceae bacterium]|nr:hypothetical protein [Sandaracinaceae bacterium]
MRLVGVAFLFFVAAIGGCGASLRYADQSAAYFEYCHAAERDPRLGAEERIACWEAFLESWALETERQRTRHAQERIAALHRGETLGAFVEERGGDWIIEPEATDIEAPAGSEQEREELLDEEARLRSPSSSCEAICELRFLKCEAACPEEHQNECRAACLAERRFCQKACT